MKNTLLALFLSVLILIIIFNSVYAQEYTPESLLIALFADGKASVEYRLSTDVTVPPLTLPLFGSAYEQLIVVDENNLIVDNRIENDSLVVDTFGTSSILITYTTDLVNKTGRFWTFALDAPIDASIRLPEDSVIIGLNQIPNSIKLSENRYALIMPEGYSEISYVIGALGTKEHANVAISEAEKVIAEQKMNGVVVSGAEIKLNESKQAFDDGKYADAEIFANDAKTIANNTGHNALLASNVLSEAERAIKESKVQGLDVSNAEQLFSEAGEDYINGNYERTLGLAAQARVVALDARNARTDYFDPVYVIVGVIVASAAGAAGTAVYIRSRKKIMIEKTAFGIPTELVVKERRIINLKKIFTERPYLREDDKETLNFIAEKGGEAFESEIRDKFDLPKTTVWRLVKRLEREELVEVKKAGGQNLVRIREEFTRTDQDSMEE